MHLTKVFFPGLRVSLKIATSVRSGELHNDFFVKTPFERLGYHPIGIKTSQPVYNISREIPEITDTGQ